MENEMDNHVTENPERGANICSKLFFIWAIPFFKKTINSTEFHPNIRVLPLDDAEILGERIETAWMEELNLAKEKKRLPLLWNAIMSVFKKEKIFCDVIVFFNYVILRPALCIMLIPIITSFREHITYGEALKGYDRCIVGAAFVTLSLLIFLIDHATHYQQSKIGMRMKIAVSSLIYRKVLNLHADSINKTLTTNILNIMSEDLKHFQNVAVFGSKACICLIQFFIIAFTMYTLIGLLSVTGLLFILIFIYPTVNSIGQILKSHKMEIQDLSKSRVNLVKEILEGIKTIKMNTWERPFKKLLIEARKSELYKITNYFNYNLTFYFLFIHKFVLFLSLLAMFMNDKYLVPEQVFPCAQFLFIAVISGMHWFPKSLQTQANITATLDSITSLLLLPEIKKVDTATENKPEIILKRICVNWYPKYSFDLRIEDIRIQPGDLYLITGPKSSGKTTFLHLIISELIPKCGTVDVKGSISYCSQKPWIFPSTIRNNILFGNQYRETRYKNVINACNLLPDFSQFMNEDFSKVGPGGVFLEDDKKSRINLARTIYPETDIYLVDDVLSLMESEIADKIFDECFTRYLARKTRLIVSNQTRFLDRADHIIVISKGRAQIFDNLAQVKDNKIDVYNWMEDQSGHNKYVEPSKNKDKGNFMVNEHEECNEYYHIEETYLGGLYEYIKSGQFLLGTSALLILSYGIFTISDYWMTHWSSLCYDKTDHNRHVPKTPIIIVKQYPIKSNLTNLLDIPPEAKTHLITYSCLILTSLFFSVLSNGFFINFCKTAARRLHENMSHAVLYTSIKFFTSESLCKIFNTFYHDVEIVDVKFAESVMLAVQIFLHTIGCILLVYVAEPTLIYSSIIIIFYYLLQKWHFRVSERIKSFEKAARYPILSQMKYTLQGLITIRVNKGKRKSILQFQKLLNNHTSLYRLNLACIFSFAMWSDLLCNVFLALTIFGLIIYYDIVCKSNPFNCGIDPSYSGLAILQIYELTEVLQYGIKNLMYSIQNTNSINNIIRYGNLPKEEADSNQFHDSSEFSSKSKLSLISLADYRLAPDNWPNEGVIEFKNVTMIYLDNKQGLDDVNFNIKSHEKIGIVGKPGSGKSSLVSAIVNLNDFDGTITIDNVDTKFVVLEWLRKYISVVQEPKLFSECIAYNLDPNGKYSDSELWKVLEEVNLKCCVNSLADIVNCTTRFTKGQKQLLSLAVAILQKNKILILDDVAKNLDEETQILFHELVIKYFCDCTVLYITSTINATIMKCDRVIVMEDGKVVEFDHPFSLLESESSFYNLVMQAGRSVYSHYRHLAYQKYVEKFKCTERLDIG